MSARSMLLKYLNRHSTYKIFKKIQENIHFIQHSTVHLVNITFYLTLNFCLDYDKCERCRKAPATLECVECGTSQRGMKHCYECDKQYHKMFEKDGHTRATIKFDQ